MGLTVSYDHTTAGVVHLHGDHLRSIAAVMSGSGSLLRRQQFTPWGQVRAGGVGKTTCRFTGQRKDGTGLLFYNARYYDPRFGRFVSVDSIGSGMVSTCDVK